MPGNMVKHKHKHRLCCVVLVNIVKFCPPRVYNLVGVALGERNVELEVPVGYAVGMIIRYLGRKYGSGYGKSWQSCAG